MLESENSWGKTRIWQVSGLLGAMADAVQARFNPVTVQGEVSGFTRAASGHCYFSIKDAQSQLRCAMFRRSASLLDFAPRDGDVVELRGRLDIYPARGELQLIVESMQRAGQGALMAEFMALKARMEAQGWFDAARKKAVPQRPRHLGVVTSLQAAALRDVATTLQRRMPHVAVTIYPASVQGERAVPELLEALEQAATDHVQRGLCDSLLLVRGGGALEDLWSFNDERLALALTRMPMPVICGVGHESDFTIADFVADLRAPTPTAAAELAGLALADDGQRVRRLNADLRSSVERALQQAAQRLDRAEQWLARPGRQLAQQQARWQQAAHRLQSGLTRTHQRQQQRLQDLQWQWRQETARGVTPVQGQVDAWSQRLIQAMQHEITRREQRVSQLSARLEALSPQQTLARGYAWLAHADGRLIASAQQVHSGDAVRARLVDGDVDLTAN